MNNKINIKKYVDIYFNVLLSLVLIGTGAIGMLQPIMADDYSNIGDIKARGFVEFFKSIYLNWSGRITDSLFLGLNSINNDYFILAGLFLGIVFILLIVFVVTCALGKFPKLFSEDRLVFILGFAIIWFGTPGLGEVVFWRTGAGVYLIPMFLGISFILPYTLWYRNKNVNSNIIFSILMLLLGFMGGSSQEQVFSAIFLFISLWFIYIKKNKVEVPKYLYWGLVGLIIGGMVLILAPGNFVRFDFAEHSSLPYKIASLLAYFLIYYFVVPVQQLWIWIVFVLLIITVLKLSDKKVEDSIFKFRILNKKFYFWLFIGVTSVLPMIAFPSSVSARTCFFFIVFISIALISLFDGYRASLLKFNESKIAIVITFIVLNIILVDVGIGVGNGYLLSKEVKHRETIILENKAKGITNILVDPLDIMPFHTTYIYDVKIDNQHAVNKVTSSYYNIKSITLNRKFKGYRVEEDLDAVDSIKNRLKEKLK
ncbi:DUF6056 family protein [Clostridium sp. CF012]|uniref:DUF6056 family protein n=1 Tax=Clostridium sp. CF012 TaxID=2843319 RepID=UPI001C0DF1CB|nr:DUF6056 family protein [Clostridium sp. CF012]MBU3143460.1 hypothetical protein [Clostridium sp. CF012]